MEDKFTGIYCKTSVRTRLKALAWVARVPMAEYLEALSKAEMQRLTPELRRESIEAVTDGSPENV